MKANISFNRISKLLVSGLGVVGLLWSHSAAAVDARLGHVFTDQHPRGLAMQRFAAEVEKGTGGKIVVKLFDEIGPRYAARNGGYLRILKCGFRDGDNAPMAFVELLDQPEAAVEAEAAAA